MGPLDAEFVEKLEGPAVSILIYPADQADRENGVDLFFNLEQGLEYVYGILLLTASLDDYR